MNSKIAEIIEAAKRGEDEKFEAMLAEIPPAAAKIVEDDDLWNMFNAYGCPAEDVAETLAALAAI